MPARSDDPRAPLSVSLPRALGTRLWVVHRLDAATSGLIVFAKDPEAHRRMSQAFQARTAVKTYLAAVAGLLEDGATDLPLKTFGSGRVGPSPEGKPSETAWKAVERFADATLIEVSPKTGRRHQIRAHLNAVGHPVLGDRKYGPPPRPVGGAPRLMLHAWRLSLPGVPPLEAPPPPDFAAVLAGLRSAREC